MNEITNLIRNIGIIPVVKIDNPDYAVPLAKALLKGGIPIAEITFRTAFAKEAITRISKEVPQLLVGAGTVLTVKQVDDAIEAGARFIVSPGLSETTVLHCQQKNIPVFPGCSSASDLERAAALDLAVVKFFPAENIGGLGALKAYSGPFPMLKFIPTGGINENNLTDYLAFEKVIACGGSWMVPASLINAARFDEIEGLCRKAIVRMHGFTFAHLGINHDTQEEAQATVKAFSQFLFPVIRETADSLFVNEDIEVMRRPGRGRLGHIAYKVNDIERALYWLNSLGITVDHDAVFSDPKGTLAVYLKEEIAGFAIHLLRK
jgi:2-dehydro-3-deoxyphosphogluconate aldolase/(4S)-4-hydroxy-2-oxoglutarate aldolase